MWSKKRVSDEQIKIAVEMCSTMAKACAYVNLRYSTFKRRALALGLWNPNQGRKGFQRDSKEYDKIRRITLDAVLNGNHPEESSSRVRRRVIKAGLKENKCEICGITEWNGKLITCELHHVDGDHTNHRLENLQILCPNCHSQTDSFSRVRK